MRILIVDDEAHARERLKRLVSEIDGDYEVVAEATTGEEAMAICSAHEVDLVLLDIEMPGIGGLETAAQLSGLEPPPAVIMVTAYPEHALEAFERKVDDYLVKPVRRERLLSALEGSRIPTRPQREALIDPGKPGPRRRHQLTAQYRGGLQAVPIAEVIYLQAEHKYVTVRHLKGTMLVDESLKSLEDEFADLFIRIHRNALVARRCMAGLEKDSDGSSLVQLRDCDERLSISRRHLPEIRRWLKS